MIKNLKAQKSRDDVYVLVVPLGDLGTQRVNTLEYVSFTESYEEEMRKQPGRYNYIYSIKEMLDLDIRRKEGEFKTWKGKRRKELSVSLKVTLDKSRITKDDLDNAMDADSQVAVQEDAILKLEAISNRLGGLLTALSHKKDMLKELAQHERSHMSDYATSYRVSTHSTSDEDRADEEAFESLRDAHRKGDTDG